MYVLCQLEQNGPLLITLERKRMIKEMNVELIIEW